MASPATLDPLFHATAKFRRRDFDACISLCDDLLAVNPRDQAVWFLKCRALTEKAYIDDTDMEEEGVGEVRRPFLWWHCFGALQRRETRCAGAA
jgi:hypothetical protein